MPVAAPTEHASILPHREIRGACWAARRTPPGGRPHLVVDMVTLCLHTIPFKRSPPSKIHARSYKYRQIRPAHTDPSPQKRRAILALLLPKPMNPTPKTYAKRVHTPIMYQRSREKRIYAVSFPTYQDLFFPATVGYKDPGELALPTQTLVLRQALDLLYKALNP